MNIGSILLNVTRFGSWGAAVAGAVYGAFAVVEKDASSKAKRDISQFLKSFDQKVDVTLLSRHISVLFDKVFGVGRFGRPSINTSGLATLAFFVLLTTTIVLLRVGNLPSSQDEANEPISARILDATMLPFLLAIIPDYLALWKSRIVIAWMGKATRSIPLMFLWLLDICLSIAIIEVFWMILGLLLDISHGVERGDLAPSNVGTVLIELTSYLARGYYNTITGQNNSFPGSFLSCALSTLLTSTWAFLMLVAALVVRAALSLKYPLLILTWLFDIDEHPIKIIGALAAALVFVGALIRGIL